jgi:hypothetical protein
VKAKYANANETVSKISIVRNILSLKLFSAINTWCSDYQNGATVVSLLY